MLVTCLHQAHSHVQPTVILMFLPRSIHIQRTRSASINPFGAREGGNANKNDDCSVDRTKGPGCGLLVFQEAESLGSWSTGGVSELQCK